MVELRWKSIKGSSLSPFLQYRYIEHCADASGALCGGGAWTKWKSVPMHRVSLEEAKNDD